MEDNGNELRSAADGAGRGNKDAAVNRPDVPGITLVDARALVALMRNLGEAGKLY